MVRVTGLYKWRPGATFDHEYYATTHMAFVRERLRALGVVRLESDKYVSDAQPREGQIIAASHAYFASLEDALSAVQAAGQELLSSAAKHTNLVPELCFSVVTTHL